MKNWLAIIGMLEVENEDEIFTGYRETEDFENQKLIEAKETVEPVDDSADTNTVQSQIRDLIKIIDESDFDNLELRGFSSDGIFCLIDDRICRTDVESYRNGTDWR